ncbi:WD repeat-containing protein 75-like isoform X3 [Halichondria panicea]|uniref:WD repeat-containing protein 75-like isoform X3 n=1 Tax=Halichondria panicea TaxID=6063 RepID=UPI00312B6D8F
MLPKESLQTSKLVVQGGETFNAAKVQFSEDAKWMYLSCGSHVKILSYNSREVVHTLVHHTDDVTSILINPANKMQVYTTSLDGHLALWDTTDGALLRVIDFGVPLYKLAIRPKHSDPSVFLLIGAKDDTNLRVVGMPSSVLTERQPTIPPSDQIKESKKYLRLWRTSHDLTFNRDGSHMIAYSGKVLYVYDFVTDNNNRYISDLPIQCLSVHPTRNCIATGTSTGKIVLWYNYAERGTEVVKTTLHWHAHAVGDLCFTTDGTYLVSGGEEGVLVLWQLDTHKREFRPRLGSPITHLACSPGDKYFTVGLQSNVVQVVSGLDTEVEWTIGGLRRSHTQTVDQNGINTGLVICPRSMSIVTNSTPGFIQFYDPVKESVTQQLNVTDLNYVSRPDDTPLSLTTVDHTSFSPDGDWLATVESRDDGKTVPELRMKLWQYSSSQQRYTLNTCVEPPHDRPVTSITFQPRHHTNKTSNQIPLLVSTSLDSHFKTWVLLGEEVGVSWSCQAVGYYHGLESVGACFSEDGSLLAVNFKTCLTLWDPVNCELRKTLCNPFKSGDYRCMVFGHKSSSQYLVTASETHLQVWDLLSCSVLWCVKTRVCSMVSDPLSQLTAVFVPSGNDPPSTHLYLIDPSSPTPLAVHHSVCSGQVLGGVFLPPQSGGTSTLYFMDKAQVLYGLEEEGKEKSDDSRPLLGDNVPTSERAFWDIFGGSKLQNRGSTVHHKLNSTSKPSLSLLSAPPHVLPPMPSLCLPYL